ncbi:MAG: DUF3365 domain-containing protein [Gloeocapsa sp. DLM2.Bin57]|nr:MAG: DUF3365 domain-containing protein [Gloeocapsa sp. DLM2.Bin57]
MKIFSLVLLLLSLCLFPLTAMAIADSSQLVRAVEEIESLDTMRSSLASGLNNQSETPDLQTFKEVCKPVGMRAKQLSQENGWQVKQIAKKYRNPVHAPSNLSETIALAQFEQKPELMGFWQQEKEGTHYYRRINVEASCLACHGAKNSRPPFVMDKYPQDLAFDFQEGDLRGMYSVFIPQLQQALQN